MLYFQDMGFDHISEQAHTSLSAMLLARSGSPCFYYTRQDIPEANSCILLTTLALRLHLSRLQYLSWLNKFLSWADPLEKAKAKQPPSSTKGHALVPHSELGSGDSSPSSFKSTLTVVEVPAPTPKPGFHFYFTSVKHSFDWGGLFQFGHLKQNSQTAEELLMLVQFGDH